MGECLDRDYLSVDMPIAKGLPTSRAKAGKDLRGHAEGAPFKKYKHNFGELMLSGVDTNRGTGLHAAI
jgi:hypothetical protein